MVHVVLMLTRSLSLTSTRLTLTPNLPPDIPFRAEHDQPAEDYNAEDQEDLELFHWRLPPRTRTGEQKVRRAAGHRGTSAVQPRASMYVL